MRNPFQILMLSLFVLLCLLMFNLPAVHADSIALMPVLLSPNGGKDLNTDQIDFQWKIDPSTSGVMIELLHRSSNEVLLKETLNAEEFCQEGICHYHYSMKSAQEGEYKWRAAAVQDGERIWSDYASCNWHNFFSWNTYHANRGWLAALLALPAAWLVHRHWFLQHQHIAKGK